MTLQEEQAPLDAAIVGAMIEATPETWQAIRLVAVRETSSSVEKVAMQITSPEGRREVVVPTEDLQEAVLNLLNVFRRHGPAWKTASYQASLGENGNWRFAADFAY